MLEEYTEKMMESEIIDSNHENGLLLGVRPKTFACPCGNKFIGRGRSEKSYVPLVAEQYIVGRGWLNEGPNIPAYCDPSQVIGITTDNQKYADIKELMDSVVANGQWLVLVGHEVRKLGAQSTDASTLAAICQYAKNPDNRVWIDTVCAVGIHVLREQLRIEEAGRKEVVSLKRNE